MKLNKDRVKTCSELLEAYLKKEPASNPEKIIFSGVGEKDVYNITAPFEDEGELVIAGRVEARDSEQSIVVFFVKEGDTWVPKTGAPILELQDPFYTRIGGELILGGVQTFPHPTIQDALGWRTVFYKGATTASLREFAKGPDGMKDLRIVELLDGTIGVFTRPQGDKGGRGKIGFTIVPSLDELTIKSIEEAPLLENQFVDEEWGGANELHLLSNGLIGVLGHIASFDNEGNRHYYPMAFALDTKTKDFSNVELIAIRDQFLKGPSKRPDLIDVVFSGGLVRNENGRAVLYAGISDAEAQSIEIQDPFVQHEE